MRSPALVALIVLWGVSARASSPDDPQVYALIDALRPVAQAISVDGDCSDWGAIPLFADPAGDAGGDASRDITGVAIAPLDDALLVRIDVAGTPPATGADYWIEVDYRKQQFFDLKFSLSSTFAYFDALPELGETGDGRFPWTSREVAVGASCIEVRVDYALLEPQLPAAMQGQLSGAGARSWLRVRATTGEPLEFVASEIDHGSAVGSFRLVTTPYDLDPALPSGAETPLEVGFPLQGDWYLGQGSHGTGSHASIPWAYDWHKVDSTLEEAVPERSSNASDNFSFGEPIFATADGSDNGGLTSGEPDCVPYAGCASGPNFVFQLVDSQHGILFSHLLQGSVPFAPLDPIPNGTQIGQVGNSGSSFSFPHLHHEGRDIGPEPDVSVALALTNVDVGLNPDLANDPWRRAFASWGPREGFFARRQPEAVPLLPAGGLALLGSTLMMAGARRLRR